MTLKILMMIADRHKNMAGLNLLMGSQPSLLESFLWINMITISLCEIK